jgi:hypothetical protein
MPIILAIGRHRSEDSQLEASLGKKEKKKSQDPTSINKS